MWWTDTSQLVFSNTWFPFMRHNVLETSLQRESVEDAVSHTLETTFRDINLDIIQLVLRKLVDKDLSGMLLKRYILSDPKLREKLLAVKVLLQSIYNQI